MSVFDLLPHHVPASALAIAFAVALVLGLVAVEESELRSTR